MFFWVSSLWHHARAMFGPYLSHVLLSSNSIPDRAMGQLGSLDMSIQCLIYKNLRGPSLDLIRAMFSLHLEQDNPESSNFQESVQWCLCIFCSISIFAVCLFANDTSQRIRCVTVSVQGATEAA